MSDQNKLIQDMVNQVNGYLEELDDLLLSMQKQPNNLRLIDEIEKKFKTIESTVNFYEFNNISLLAGSAKELLGSLFTRRVGLSVEHVSSLLSAVDAIREMMQEVKQTGQEPIFIYADIVVNIKKLIEGVDDLTPLELSKDDLAALPERNTSAEKPLVELNTAPTSKLKIDVDKMSDAQLAEAMVDESSMNDANDDEGLLGVDEEILNELMNVKDVLGENEPIDRDIDDMTEDEMRAAMLDESNMHKDRQKRIQNAQHTQDIDNAGSILELESTDDDNGFAGSAIEAEASDEELSKELVDLEEQAMTEDGSLIDEEIESTEPEDLLESYDPAMTKGESLIDEEIDLTESEDLFDAYEPAMTENGSLIDEEIGIAESEKQLEDDEPQVAKQNKSISESMTKNEDVKDKQALASLKLGALQVDEVWAKQVNVGSLPDNMKEGDEFESLLGLKNLDHEDDELAALEDIDFSDESLDENPAFKADLSDVEDLLEMCEDISGKDSSTSLHEIVGSSHIENPSDEKQSVENLFDEVGSKALVSQLKKLLMTTMKSSIKQILETTYQEMFNETIKFDEMSDRRSDVMAGAEIKAKNSANPSILFVESSRLLKNILTKSLENNYQIEFSDPKDLVNLLENKEKLLCHHLLIIDPALLNVPFNECLCHLRRMGIKVIVYTEKVQSYKEMDFPIIPKSSSVGDHRISKHQSLKLLKDAIEKRFAS